MPDDAIAEDALAEDLLAEDVPPRRPRLRLWGLLCAAGWLGVATTILGHGGRLWWLLDLATHFRCQLLLGLALCAAAMLAFRRWAHAATFGVVALLNLGLVAPLYVGGEAPPPSAPRHRLLAANVYVNNQDPEPLLALIRKCQPDVVILQETDERWLDELAPLAPDYRWRVDAPREDPFGMCLLSRVPLAEPPKLYYPGKWSLPTIRVRLRFPTGVVTVVGTHPVPPTTAIHAVRRDEQLRELAAVLADEPRPLLLAGDLNTTSWSPVFADLARTSGLRDSRHGFGVQPTFPAKAPMLGIPIDHCLVSEDVVVLDRRVGPDIGSDHLPVLVDFAIRPRSD